MTPEQLEEKLQTAPKVAVVTVSAPQAAEACGIVVRGMRDVLIIGPRRWAVNELLNRCRRRLDGWVAIGSMSSGACASREYAPTTDAASGGTIDIAWQPGQFRGYQYDLIICAPGTKHAWVMDALPGLVERGGKCLAVRG